MNTEALTRITSPKAPRPGATEERIYADKQKARKTAELVAALGLPKPRRASMQEGK